MHLYILAVHNCHIMISTNDLQIVTNALFLLPIFCQCKVFVLTNLYQPWLVKKLLKTFCISLPIGTNGKPLAAISKFPNAIGKLMIGKTFAANGEEITNAMINSDVLAVYW